VAHLGLGRTLLEGVEEHDHQLIFTLNLEQAECEYLVGHFDEAEAMLDAVMSIAASRYERAQIYRLRTTMRTILSKHREAARAGREGLALFGIELPELDHEQQAALMSELNDVDVNVAGRRIDELVDVPPTTDPDIQSVLQLLMDMTASAAVFSPTQLALIIAKQVNISLKHGHSPASAYGYVAYGYLLAAMLGQPEKALAFGKLGLSLDERFNSIDLTCRLNQLFAVYAHFSVALRDTLVHSAKAYQAGITSGDFLYLSFACGQIFMHRLGAGDGLGDLRDEVERLLALMERTNSRDMTAVLKAGRQFIACLEGRTKDTCSLSDDAFDEVAIEQYMIEMGMAYALFWFYTLKLQLLYLHGRYADALEMIQKAERHSAVAAGFYCSTDLVFYTCLTLAAVYPAATTETRQEYLTKLTTHQAKLAGWADSCPANYQHKNLLVLAEQARILGENATAMELYDRAIMAANKSGCAHHEALACELGARFYTGSGRERAARAYVSDSYHAYLRWGAVTKLKALTDAYPSVLFQAREPQPATPQAAPTTDETRVTTGKKIVVRDATRVMTMELLDIAAVIRTAHAIAGEVEIEKVLNRFMRIVLDNSGAQKGFLILEREGSLIIVASATTSPNVAHTGLEIPLDTAVDLPISVVQYVSRTKQPVLLGDTEDLRFATDTYISSARPKSMLCIAMTHQGHLTGVLYLENSVIQDAFTPARLELLMLLSSQAAIAIENARLYAHVQLRTEELRKTEERLKLELIERERAENDRVTLQEEIIRVQKERLAELSTPLIPITDRIMVMPLIGMMDQQRAHQVLETALQGVQSNRAEVVIIDITCVRIVDTDVASTLISTGAALRLLGSQVIITGIRPEVAQTLVGLHVDFGAIVTKGSLQGGIAYALRQTGEANTSWSVRQRR